MPDSLQVAERLQFDPIDPRGRAMEVIDTDFHFLPDWNVLRGYMQEPFRSGLRRYPDVGSEYQPDQAVGIVGSGGGSSGQSILGVARTAADVIGVIDRIGVSTVIISPGFQRPHAMFNPTYLTATASAYNDYVADKVLPASDRIYAEIMINQRDAAAGAAEIRRVAHNRKFVGIYCDFGADAVPIGSAEHDPILAAAAEFDLPITIHVGGFWQPYTSLARGARTWTECLGIAPVGNSMAFVASLIMQGAFDKFPNLRIMVKESGYWWVPEFMLRADDFYLCHPGDIRYVERKLELGEDYLRKLPSEYLLEHFRFASQPMCRPKSPEHFRWLLELCHAETLLCYSSDWPHATFDPLNWVVENPGVIDAALQKKIFSGNARALYSRLA